MQIYGCMPVLPLVQEFYGIQAVEILAVVDPFQRSQEGWARRLETYKHTYEIALAQAMFDYLVIICYGELRHGTKAASHYNPEITQRAMRNDAYYDCRKHPAVDIVKAALVGYGPEIRWHDSYGGKAWLKIAKAAAMWGKVPHQVFIDHCVDLAHNGTFCFDKIEAGIFSFRSSNELIDYETFLKQKGELTPQHLLRRYLISTQLRRMAETAMEMGVIREEFSLGSSTYNPSIDEEDVNKWVRLLLDRTPVEWGEVPLSDYVEEVVDEHEDEDDNAPDEPDDPYDDGQDYDSGGEESDDDESGTSEDETPMEPLYPSTQGFFFFTSTNTDNAREEEVL